MTKPWKLQWHEFQMPDGLKAMWAYGPMTTEVHMSVDDGELPEGMSASDRLAECYDHFFVEVFPTTGLM